jgi:SAM-dependent methyltransferase
MSSSVRMTLLDLVNRKPVPEPWGEGDNIPWDEPGFSSRMLAEHLSQAHDAASRRYAKIDRHVQWIHSVLLGGRPARVLDLCCGPGLYASRLAALGQECVGIDFAPAAIAHAKRQAADAHLACRYVCDDVRRADFGAGFGLVMMVYGQANVFSRDHARAILRKARQALSCGGTILLEPHTLAAVERMGKEGASWYSARSGLFSERPHLVLQEHFWDAAQTSATTRFCVIDASDAGVTRYAMTTQGYTDEEYAGLLCEAGFADVRFLPSLTGGEDSVQLHFFVLTAVAAP